MLVSESHYVGLCTSSLTARRLNKMVLRLDEYGYEDEGSWVLLESIED